MSFAPDITQQARASGMMIIAGLVGVAMLAAVLFLGSGQQQQALRSSPTGLDGLEVWLAQNDQNVRSFSGGWPIDAAAIGLQIIPIYDTIFREARTPPDTVEALIQQQDEYDLDAIVLREKAAQVPTLVVLPKWRSGMRLTGLAHPALRSEEKRIGIVASVLIGGWNVQLNRAPAAFTEYRYDGTDADRKVVLYAAQTLSALQCAPIIGTRDAMVLGRCPLLGRSTGIYVLSDPDLINNHGLRLGDNAYAVRDWIKQTADGAQVLIDYSPRNWLTVYPKQSSRERTWSDLMRFVAPPFSTMWAGLGLAIALVLWRSGVRFGPASDGPTTIGASKSLAIGARAKLMRLSNRDGALAREYVTTRLEATATSLFGAAQASRFAAPDAFVAFVQRRHPSHAPQLIAALNGISSLSDHTPASHAMASVAALDRILETIKHDT